MITVKAKKDFYFFGRGVKTGENVQISRDDYDAWLRDDLCFKINDLDKAKIDDITAAEDKEPESAPEVSIVEDKEPESAPEVSIAEDKEPESAPEVSIAEDKKPKSKSKLKTEKVK